MNLLRPILLPALGAALLLGVAASAGRAATLQPHRAIYELSLKSVGTSHNIVDVKGAIYYEFAETCKGWKVRHTTRMQILNRESKERVRLTEFSSWESKDGRAFTFNSKTRLNGKLRERYRGRASLKGLGEGGRAVFTQPRRLVVVLPRSTVFPTNHIVQILDRAAAGEMFVWRVVFDGADGKTLYAVNAAIGAAKGPVSGKEPLLSTGSLPMSLAYFLTKGKKAQPEYQLSLRLHNNGVTSDMVIDYGDFVLDAKLKQVQVLPRAKC